MPRIDEAIVARTVNLVYNTHSRNTYASALEPLIGSDLNRGSIQKIVDGWHDAARSTIVVRKAALTKLIRVAASDGLCEPNLLEGIVFPSGKPGKARRSLSGEEVNRLYSAVESDEELFLLTLLLDTGIRVGTACVVKVWQLKEKSFVVVSKGSHEVQIYTTSALRTLAQRMPWDDNDYIFGGKDPTYPRRLARIIKSIATRVDLEFVSPHWLRHTFVTRAERHGGLDAASRLAGHRSVNTTRRYVHQEDDHLLNIVESSSYGGKHVSD